MEKMISRNDLKKLAVDLFDICAIKTGTPRTPIYIDLKPLILHQELLARLSTMLWLLTDLNENYDRICGVPFEASSRYGVPYTAITYAFQISTQTSIPILMRRQGKSIEGQFEIGDRVVIVDDEISNGSNILEMAVDLIKEKLKIGEALVVVDREQGGRENLENAGIKMKSLFKFNELVEFLREAGKIPIYGRAINKDHTKILQYSKEMPNYSKDHNTRGRGFIQGTLQRDTAAVGMINSRFY